MGVARDVGAVIREFDAAVAVLGDVRAELAEGGGEAEVLGELGPALVVLNGLWLELKGRGRGGGGAGRGAVRPPPASRTRPPPPPRGAGEGRKGETPAAGGTPAGGHGLGRRDFRHLERARALMREGARASLRDVFGSAPWHEIVAAWGRAGVVEFEVVEERTGRPGRQPMFVVRGEGGRAPWRAAAERGERGERREGLEEREARARRERGERGERGERRAAGDAVPGQKGPARKAVQAPAAGAVPAGTRPRIEVDDGEGEGLPLARLSAAASAAPAKKGPKAKVVGTKPETKPGWRAPGQGLGVFSWRPMSEEVVHEGERTREAARTAGLRAAVPLGVVRVTPLRGDPVAGAPGSDVQAGGVGAGDAPTQQLTIGKARKLVREGGGA